MAYTLKQIDSKPIFIATFTEPYNAVKDAGAIDAEMLPKLDKIEGTIYYISDLRQIDIKFGEMITGLQQAFASGVDTIYTNPRTKILTVGDQDLLRLGTEAVKTQEQYKKIPVELFATVEEAITRAEALMSEQIAS